MYKSKLVKLLERLSTEEFKRLNKILRSPLYTSNPNLVPLYQLLRKHHPDFHSPKLNKAAVFKKLFPDHPYSDIKLRNLMHEMTRLVEDYLIHLRLQEQPYQRQQLLAEIYGERQLYPLLDKSIQQLRQELEAQIFRDAAYYQQSFQLHHLKMSHLSIPNKMEKLTLYRHAEQDLDYLYGLHKLWFDCEEKNIGSLYTLDEQGKQREIYQYLKLDNEHLLYRLYEDIIRLQEQQDDQLFELCSAQFFTSLDYIRIAQREELFVWLNNYLVRKMKEDDAHYNQLLFDFYKKSLEQGILFRGSQLINSFYLNIVTVSAKAKAFDWARNFILEYDQYLLANTKEDTKNLGLAYLYFHQQEYSRAVDQLSDYHFVHPLHALSARIHSLRCYYELFAQDSSYYELLIAQSQAFERLVRRHKSISKERKEAYQHFAQFLRRLANARLGGKLRREEQRKLRGVLDNQKITMSRSWLLAKIET